MTCLTLERKHFDRLMGPMSEVLNRNVFRSVFVAIPAAKSMTDNEIDAVVNATDVATYAPGDVILDQVRHCVGSACGCCQPSLSWRLRESTLTRVGGADGRAGGARECVFGAQGGNGDSHAHRRHNSRHASRCASSLVSGTNAGPVPDAPSPPPMYRSAPLPRPLSTATGDCVGESIFDMVQVPVEYQLRAKTACQCITLTRDAFVAAFEAAKLEQSTNLTASPRSAPGSTTSAGGASGGAFSDMAWADDVVCESLDDFEVLKVLGSGAFGIVKMVKHKEVRVAVIAVVVVAVEWS